MSLAANNFPDLGDIVAMHVNQGRHPCRRAMERAMRSDTLTCPAPSRPTMTFQTTLSQPRARV
jgi:hypothetical protein